jgi:nucleoid-associated protein YgaU
MKMKNIIISLIILVFAFELGFSQQMPPASKPDVELTKEEAVLRIKSWIEKVTELETKLAKLESNKTSLMQEIEQAKRDLKDCQDALLAMLGANEADLDAFRQQLGIIAGKVRAMQGLSNDELADRRADVVALEGELNKLRTNKISLLPEFYNKIISLAKDIKGLYREKKVTTYTVGTWAENRDCLWNIAGKKEIYNDPHLWPKIWQANTDIIRNPDVIFPGQVLTLPNNSPKNAEELKAERKYYRMKKETVSQDAQTGTVGNE